MSVASPGSRPFSVLVRATGVQHKKYYFSTQAVSVISTRAGWQFLENGMGSETKDATPWWNKISCVW